MEAEPVAAPGPSGRHERREEAVVARERRRRTVRPQRLRAARVRVPGPHDDAGRPLQTRGMRAQHVVRGRVDTRDEPGQIDRVNQRTDWA
jgi:hypothetical protein